MSARTRTAPPAGLELAIRRIATDPPPGPAAIDRFVGEHAFPLVEGASVTFVWRGEAEAVFLRHFVFGLPARQPLVRIAGTDVWHHTIDLPDGSRVEYKFEVVRDGKAEWVEDPLNAKRARDPFGANSVVHARGYEVPEWTQPNEETRRGSLDTLVLASDALGRETRVDVYLPARFRRSRRYPLLVVHDGGDYLAYSGLQTVLDNLIHRLEVAEIVVACTHPGERLAEYANDPRHVRFVNEELPHALAERFPLADSADARGLMGASFGAVASFAAAHAAHAKWGRLLLQSGSFAFSDIGPGARGEVFEPVVEFVNAYRARPIPVAKRVFVSCGQYESLIYENRSLVPILSTTGMEVKYVESRDGHNWENWRDRLRDGLSWLFPGPVWLVYE